MADPIESWGGPSFWQMIIAAIGMIGSFVWGSWSRGVASGKSEGGSSAKIDYLTDRVARAERTVEALEARVSKMDDRLDEKISRIAERVAATPTRDEIAAAFARLEAKLDVRRDEGK